MSEAERLDAGANVFTRLRVHYDALSKGERAVADHLLQNATNLAFLSISDLAASVGTSESTIVRLVRKLDYPGFVAFKKALLAEIVVAEQRPAVPARTHLGAATGPAEVAAELIAVMKTALADTAEHLTAASFSEAVAHIARSDRIEIYANHQSGHIASTSIYRFLTAGIQADARIEPLSQHHYAAHLAPTDAVIVLSHGGLAPNLLDIMATAKRRGAPVIAVTSNGRSPIAKAADTHLHVPLPSATLSDEAGVIRIAQLAVLECLAVAAASHRLRASADADAPTT